MMKFVLKYVLAKRVIKFENYVDYIVNKTGFLRPGHIYYIVYVHMLCKCTYVRTLTVTYIYVPIHYVFDSTIQRYGTLHKKVYVS